MKKQYLPLFFFLSAVTASAQIPSANAFPLGTWSIPLVSMHPQNLLQVGDGPRFLPTEPDDPVQTTVEETIEKKLKSQFDAATANSNHMLTVKVAEAASWGFVVDHFTEIDKNHDGYATLAEISSFLEKRSPMKMKSMEKPVQVIE